MKWKNNKRIFLFSFILLSFFVLSLSFYFPNKNINLYEENSKITRKEENFILKNKEILINLIESIGLNYVISNWDFFVSNIKYNINKLSKLSNSVNNGYYPINIYTHTGNEENESFKFIFATNNKMFNPKKLEITYDFKLYDNNNIYEDQKGTLNFIDEVFLKTEEKLFDNLYFYEYEINDLIWNATDYYDFNFYYENNENPIFSSKIDGVDNHILTSFNTNPININDHTIKLEEDKESIYCAYTLSIPNPSPNIYISYQLDAIRIQNKKELTSNNSYFYYTIASTSKNINYVRRDGNNIVYEIYNIPSGYYNFLIQTTNKFKYNYFDQQFYPIYLNYHFPNEETLSMKITYSNSKYSSINDIFLKNNNLIIIRKFNNESNNLEISYNKKNDYLSDFNKEYKVKNIEEWEKLYLDDAFAIYRFNFNDNKNLFKEIEIGYEYSNFEFSFEGETSYFLPFKISTPINNENANAEITNVNITKNDTNKIIFDITFKNATILQMENIDISYEVNGNVRYASDYDNLQLVKKVDENKEETTYQFRLINLDNEYAYSNFKIYLPETPKKDFLNKNHLINSKYETSYYYDYDENVKTYYTDNNFYLKENHYLYILLVIPIFLLIVFILYLINLYKKRKRINDMDENL